MGAGESTQCVCPVGWFPVCGRASVCGFWERRLLVAGFDIQAISGLPDVAVWLHRQFKPVVQIRAGLSALGRENWCCRAAMEAERRLRGEERQLARLECLAGSLTAGD